MPIFHIRPGSAAAHDDSRVLSYFDSQLSWLASRGSGGQWGSSPRSDKEETKNRYKAKIEANDRFASGPLKPGWVKFYVAEVDVEVDSVADEVRVLGRRETGLDEGMIRIPVAIMVLAAESAEYVRSILPERDEQDPFVFLSVLISDRRTASIGKGAGSFLIEHAKEEAKRLGVKRICGDCWRGNERSLVRYYERQGFTAIGDFGIEAKDNWPGAVFEMRLDD